MAIPHLRSIRRGLMAAYRPITKEEQTLLSAMDMSRRWTRSKPTHAPPRILKKTCGTPCAPRHPIQLAISLDRALDGHDRQESDAGGDLCLPHQESRLR